MTDAEREYLIIYLIGYLLGRHLETLDTTKGMLQSGVPLADIMRFTGVSEEELVTTSWQSSVLPFQKLSTPSASTPPVDDETRPDAR